MMKPSAHSHRRSKGGASVAYLRRGDELGGPIGCVFRGGNHAVG